MEKPNDYTLERCMRECQTRITSWNTFTDYMKDCGIPSLTDVRTENACIQQIKTTYFKCRKICKKLEK